MKYSIFHHTIESNIPLPELQRSNDTPPTLFFNSSAISKAPQVVIDWFHHWRLPNGQISISVGKDNKNYWLRFPHLVDFKLHSGSNYLTSYRYTDIPDKTIRHLLLDQVIPRLLSHQGYQILHASSIKISDSALVFCGESGWGKSTIAAFYHSQGHTILTDDCLLLQKTDFDEVVGIPNYQGIRLFQDSISLVQEEYKTQPVAHYGTKKRIITTDHARNKATQIKAIFILPGPKDQINTDSVSISPISGVVGAIELIKNSFPLDITDKNAIGYELQRVARIAHSKKLHFYQLNYPREMELLPQVMKQINLIMSSY